MRCLAVAVHPSQAFLQREFRQDVEVRAVRFGVIDLANERDPAEHIAFGVNPVLAPVDESESEEPAGRSK